MTGVNLSHWNVASAVQGWDIQGYTADPVGTVRPAGITVAGATSRPNVASNVSDLELTDVVIDGQPQ